MATYYLKNVSGALVEVKDIGIVLPNNTSLPIDSNGIPGWLTPELADKLNTPSELILSETDVGDASGDLTPAQAIQALTLVSRFDHDNPNNVTFTQVVAADPGTDITAAEAELLTNGSDITLHIHDNRYYTKTQLQTGGQSVVSWGNIVNAPSFGAPQWQGPVVCVAGVNTTAPVSPTTGTFYISSLTNHLMEYNGSAWVDLGVPAVGASYIDSITNKIFTWTGSSWTSVTPTTDWAVMVQNDGEGHAAQYLFDGTNWIKIADVAWGTHNSLSGRDVANTHPATTISYSNAISGLTAVNVQDALDQLMNDSGVEVDNVYIVAKNGNNAAQNVILGSLANPYGTIQAAISAVPTTGADAASATKRYAILVLAGTYTENIVLSKDYVYVMGLELASTVVTSASGNTATIVNTIDGSTGIGNITLSSTSTDPSSNALVLNGNDPHLHNLLLVNPIGNALYISAPNNFVLDTVYCIGNVHIDNGTTNALNFFVTNGTLNVTNGTVILDSANLQNSIANVLNQSGGNIRFIFGKITQSGTHLAVNQTAGSIEWGWIDCDNTKTSFGGTKTLIFQSINLAYNNVASNMSATNVQAAVDELDGRLDTAANTLSTHIADHANPHVTTLTQVIAADPAAVGITVAELETLVNGSNADTLHSHSASDVSYNKVSGDLQTTNVQTSIDFIAKYYKVNPQSIIFVAKNGSDTALDNNYRGMASAPYLTIQAAINRIEFNNDNSDSNPYVVVIGPGIYTDNLVFNDTRLVNVTFIGNATVVDTPSGDAFNTSVNNINLNALNIFGITFKDNVVIEGSLTGSTILSSGVKFKNCKFLNGLFLNNIVRGEIDESYIKNGATRNCSQVNINNSTISGTEFFAEINVADKMPTAMAGLTQFKDCQINAQLRNTTQSIIQAFNTIIQSLDVYGTMTLVSSHVSAGIAITSSGVLTFENSLYDRTLINNIGGVMINNNRSSSVYYDSTLSHLATNNVQDAIDMLKLSVDAFKMPQGVVFPPTPSGGDQFYRTDLALTFQYDSTRSKWLSTAQMFLDWGASSADGKYLNIHGATATMTGYLMPRAGTIVALTVKTASGNMAKNIEIRRNNDITTPLKAFVTAGGTYSSITENIDFNAGDFVQAFALSNSVPARDIVVIAAIQWRGI